jgi:hypothetical protein
MVTPTIPLVAVVVQVKLVSTPQTGLMVARVEMELHLQLLDLL